MAPIATITKVTPTLTERQYCGLYFHCGTSTLEGANDFENYAIEWRVTSAPDGWSMRVDDNRTGGLGANGWDAAGQALPASITFCLYANVAGSYTVQVTLTNKVTGASDSDTSVAVVADTSGYTTLYINPDLTTGNNDGTTQEDAYQSWDDAYTNIDRQGDADFLFLVEPNTTLVTTSASRDWFKTAAAGIGGNIVVKCRVDGSTYSWDSSGIGSYGAFFRSCDNITIADAVFVNTSGVADHNTFTTGSGAARVGFVVVDCRTDTTDSFDLMKLEAGGSGTLTGLLSLRNDWTNSTDNERVAPDSGNDTGLWLGCTIDRNGSTSSHRAVYSLNSATRCWWAICYIENEYDNNDVGIRFRTNTQCGAVGCYVGAGVMADDSSATTDQTQVVTACEITSNTGVTGQLNVCVYTDDITPTQQHDIYSESNVLIVKSHINSSGTDRSNAYRQQDAAGEMIAKNDTVIYQTTSNDGRFGYFRPNGGTITAIDCLFINETAATGWSAAQDLGNTINSTGCTWPLTHGGKESSALGYFDINATGYSSSAAVEAGLEPGWASNTDANRTLDSVYRPDTADAATKSDLVLDYYSLTYFTPQPVGALLSSAVTATAEGAVKGNKVTVTFSEAVSAASTAGMFTLSKNNILVPTSQPASLSNTTTVELELISGGVTNTDDWRVTINNSSQNLVDSGSLPIGSQLLDVDVNDLTRKRDRSRDR